MATEQTARKQAATDRVVWLLERSAPQHPPCFDSQDQWVYWLATAAIADEMPTRPFVYRKTKADVAKPSAFNSDIDFCHDCTAAYRAEMKLQERCRPTWLRREKVAA